MANPNDNHNVLDVETLDDAMIPGATELVYTFENFFHPFVGELIKQLNVGSLPGMLDPDFLGRLGMKVGDPPPDDAFFSLYFKDYYEKPEVGEDGEGGVPAKVEGSPLEIDLHVGRPYANYNWELLFHIPLTIAVHLSKNQRFAEAQRWFHYIFDPNCNDPSLDPPKRHWKFLGFRQDSDLTRIENLIALLSKPDADCSPAELDTKTSFLSGYNDIRTHPFRPHAVARTRPLAYQYSVVMKYLDNLIAWGDSLFRQDTLESINEATQLYVLAANILGARPQQIPQRGTVRARTFGQLKSRGLDPMGNALVELEGKFPFNFGLPDGADPDAAGPLFGIGRTLYFCVPRNEKLLGYWDTVADRLFKIRHCTNIEGVVRQLALFDPPIDPGMLVKAAAAGIDVGAIVSGLNQPIPPLRSPFFIQKALELCAEVRGMGAGLLAAIEKGDGEQLALLRQGHEIQIQQMQQEVRFLQWKQAQESTESLLCSRTSALERYDFYLRLIGQNRDKDSMPDTFTHDPPAATDNPPTLTEENFGDVYAALVDQYDKAPSIQVYPQLRLAGDASAASQSGASGTSQLYLNKNEDADLNEHAPAARDFRRDASISNSIYSLLGLLPSMGVNVHFWGLGGHAVLFGGSQFSAVGQIISSSKNTKASLEDAQGASASKTGSYERRANEWILQANLAAHELAQIGKQIIASLIAEQIAQHEYQIIKKQIEHSQEIDAFLRGNEVGGKKKFTTTELYGWMQSELSRLYYEYYRFAFDSARRAEQTVKRELMRPEMDATDYVKFNYWDSGRKGLLSGEALYLDVKRLEMAYHENNKREYELTKHVSLRQLDPIAFLTLKATGSCQVTLPEWLFDLDCPGHYLRRIKHVALSIPCVAGPYTSVNCTLTLLKSSLRKSAVAAPDYQRQPTGDERFTDYLGVVQTIVTSSGQNDSGMFETNLRDERFLPFEGAGAISTWRLDLPNPADYPAFDYATISDVILHLRYTARPGVDASAVRRPLGTLFEEAVESDLALLLSLHYDFPTEWHRFLTARGADGNHVQSFSLSKDHFPYLFQGRTITITQIDLFGVAETSAPVSDLPGLSSPDNQEINLVDAEPLGQLRHRVASDISVEVGEATNQDTSWTLRAMEDILNNLDDLIIVFRYTVR